VSRYACPDCHRPLEVMPKRGQDGRCFECRADLPVNGYRKPKKGKR
jgi:hypothetical protein